MFLLKMFQRKWLLPTLLVFAGTALCIRLGIWQLDRLEQRRAFLGDRDLIELGHTFFVYRDYKWRDLPHLVHRVVKTVAMVMMLIGFSVAFGYMMTIMQIPAKVTAFFLGISSDKYVFLFLVNILLLLVILFLPFLGFIAWLIFGPRSTLR